MTDDAKEAELIKLTFRIPGRSEPLTCFPKDEATKQEWLQQAAQRGWTRVRLTHDPTPPPDHIHLLIRRHARADAEADEAYANGEPDNVKEAAYRAAWLALWKLVENGPPSTLGGIKALCDHVARLEDRDPQVSSTNDYDVRDRRFVVELLRYISRAIANLQGNTEHAR